MFTKNSVSQSMIDAVESVLVEDKKLLLEPEAEKKDRKKKNEVEEELKGNQVKLDKNHNGKLDGQDFKLLRMKKEGVLDSIRSGTRPDAPVRNEEVEISPVIHPESRKEIGIVTKQPNGGGYHALHSAASLAHKQTGTFDSKDKAHQFIHDAHAKAIKSGTLSDRFQKSKPKNEEVETVEEGSVPKEKQKSPYVDRNSPESKAKVQAARDKMAKDRAAEPGKKLLAKFKKEDIGAMQSVVGENKGKKSVRVDTLKGPTISNDPEVKSANAHFSGKAATLKAEGKGTDVPSTFVTDSATHKEINKSVKPTFKKIKEMLGKTGTSE